MGNPWLSLIMSVGNKAGVIPSAPQGLQNLKEAIKGVPFQLLQKGMSGVMDVNNIMQGVSQFSQQLGSLGQLGSFGSMLGQFQGMATSISGIASLGPSTLSSVISTSDLVAAMGPNQAMMTALTQFAPIQLIQGLNTDSGQPADANITNDNNNNNGQTATNPNSTGISSQNLPVDYFGGVT